MPETDGKHAQSSAGGMTGKMGMRPMKLTTLLIAILFIWCFEIFLNATTLMAVEIKGSKKYLDYASQLQKNKQYVTAEKVYTKGIKKHPDSLLLLYKRARLRHVNLKNFGGAIKDFTKVIRMDPKYSTKAYWRRGECFARLGFYKYAIKDYNTCIKLGKGRNEKAIMKRAKLNAFLGNNTSSIKDLQILIKNKSKYSKAALFLYNDILSGKRIQSPLFQTE